MLEEREKILDSLLLAAIQFTLKCFNTGVCQDVFSLLISDVGHWEMCNHLVLDFNLFRLLSSETYAYSGFQIWLKNSHCSSHWIEHLVQKAIHWRQHSLTKSRVNLYANPLTNLMTSLLFLLLFQLSSGYGHHVVLFQISPCFKSTEGVHHPLNWWWHVSVF